VFFCFVFVLPFRSLPHLDPFPDLQADFFKNYEAYMKNFGECLLHFALMANKYKELGPITKAFEDFQAKSSRLSLESLVVMPVQRLPRYILLLKEMKKYTGKVNPKEEEMLGVVLEKVQGIMTELNQKTPKGNLDSVKQLQMILESVEGELHVGVPFLFKFCDLFFSYTESALPTQ